MLLLELLHFVFVVLCNFVSKGQIEGNHVLVLFSDDFFVASHSVKLIEVAEFVG